MEKIGQKEEIIETSNPIIDESSKRIKRKVLIISIIIVAAIILIVLGVMVGDIITQNLKEKSDDPNSASANLTENGPENSSSRETPMPEINDTNVTNPIKPTQGGGGGGGGGGRSCVANCAGKICGNNGCSGSCGTCGEGTQCSAGLCVGPGTCGDDTCSEGKRLMFNDSLYHLIELNKVIYNLSVVPINASDAQVVVDNESYGIFRLHSYSNSSIGYVRIYVTNITYQDFIGGIKQVEFIFGENNVSCGRDCLELTCSDFNFDEGELRVCNNNDSAYDFSWCQNVTHGCTDEDIDDTNPYFNSSGAYNWVGYSSGQNCNPISGSGGSGGSSPSEGDVCNDSYNLIEKVCNGANITEEIIDCRDYGKVCDSGACIDVIESCTDGIKNQNEQETDCGGVCDKKCAFFGVFHSIHTGLSDGRMTQIQRTDALDIYYDWAATIDHDHKMSQSDWGLIISETDSANIDHQFTYMAGYEWKGSSGAEVSVFFETAPGIFAQGNTPVYNTFSELLDWLEIKNGTGCMNHPAREGNVYDWNNPYINEGSEKGYLLPCIEILNKDELYWDSTWECAPGSGCTSYSNPNPPNSPHWSGGVKTALDRGMHLGFVGGWDYHYDYPGSPTAYTGIINASLTKQGVVNATRARHTWAAQDKILMDVAHDTGTETKLMGDIFSTIEDSIQIDYNISASTGETITTINIFIDGIIVDSRAVATQNVSSSFSYTFLDNFEHYIFVEAIEADGDRAWSSPMYVTKESGFASLKSNPVFIWDWIRSFFS
ncbi:hypothetical protein GOV14_01540 [Candidatus Pacearchaeota archaeon]|nr:hypothetical protein [Candidatus Pacearchaeota archaeon]